MIAFGVVAMIIGIVQKEFFMIPGALVLIGLMAFLLYYFGIGNRIRNEYNDIVMRYGKDELVRQMTSDKATVFYLNKNDPQSYVIGTEEYLILAYDNIYPWESIDCVNIRKHVFTQQEINYSYDQEGRDRMTYAYAVEIHFKSGLTRNNLMISLVPEELSRFAEYLRTKVPEVHRV